MLRGAPVLLDETLKLLESRDDALLARRPARFLVRLDLDAQLLKKGSIFFGELRHGPRPLSFEQERPPPRPCASPRHRAM
jgi:hypothetical protein